VIASGLAMMMGQTGTQVQGRAIMSASVKVRQPMAPKPRYPQKRRAGKPKARLAIVAAKPKKGRKQALVVVQTKQRRRRA
jgi:hypothetical protein